ncbi:MAG: CYTH and CHAD domain-containing protein [Pseudomonadota bacterium]
MDEIELKVLIDAAAERRLRRHPALRRFGNGPAKTARLVSIYYDTEDGALASAGIALRLRRKGDTWVQTVKIGRSLTAGLSEAVESDTPVGGEQLDLPAIADDRARIAVLKATNGADLHAVYRSDIRRTTRLLAIPDAGEVELAIDVGEIVAGDRSEPLREVELEARTGGAAATFAAARVLFDRTPVHFSRRTKAERGALLRAEGRIEDPLHPRRARPVAIKPKQRLAEALPVMLAECLEQIDWNAAVVRHSDDPEGPHQLRIGLRRLRTIAETLPGEAAAHLVAEARWLGREVGRLRDLDVLSRELVAPALATHPGDDGLAALRSALVGAAETTRAELHRTLASPRVQHLLLDLAEMVSLPTVGDTGLGNPRMEKFARKVLEQCFAKAAKRGRKIDSLTTEERHALRKALKRLRYAADFFAPIFPAPRVKAFGKRLRRLQETLGLLNDHAMAEEVLADRHLPGLDAPAVAFAAGRIVGHLATRFDDAWPSAKGDWAALAKAHPFWT